MNAKTVALFVLILSLALPYGRGKAEDSSKINAPIKWKTAKTKFLEEFQIGRFIFKWNPTVKKRNPTAKEGNLLWEKYHAHPLNQIV